MESISQVLSNKFVRVTQSKKPINTTWELADEFAQYVGLKTPFVLRIFKKYGIKKVLGIKSWLKDAPRKPGKSFEGLVIWKLKQK